MDQRREPRYPIGQPVTVTILSGDRSTHEAVIQNGSGNGLALEMPIAVKPGVAIRIDGEDSLLLGEAVHCSPRPEKSGGGFLVGVLLECELSQLSRLAQMLEGFSEGEAPAWRPNGPNPGGVPQEVRKTNGGQ